MLKHFGNIAGRDLAGSHRGDRLVKPGIESLPYAFEAADPRGREQSNQLALHGREALGDRGRRVVNVRQRAVEIIEQVKKRYNQLSLAAPSGVGLLPFAAPPVVLEVGQRAEQRIVLTPKLLTQLLD